MLVAAVVVVAVANSCCSPRVGLSTCREIKQVCLSVRLSVSVWSIEGQAGPAGDEDPDPKRSTHTSAHVWQQKRPEQGTKLGSRQARLISFRALLRMAGLSWSILCCQTSAPGCGGPQNTSKAYGPILPVLVAVRHHPWCCGAVVPWVVPHCAAVFLQQHPVVVCRVRGRKSRQTDKQDKSN